MIGNVRNFKILTALSPDFSRLQRETLFYTHCIRPYANKKLISLEKVNDLRHNHLVKSSGRKLRPFALYFLENLLFHIALIMGNHYLKEIK